MSKVEYNKKYYEQHSEKLKSLQKKNYEENKETIMKRNAEYREANKKKLNKKIVCKCSGQYMFKNRSIHFKSKKHQIYLVGFEDGKTNND